MAEPFAKLDVAHGPIIRARQGEIVFRGGVLRAPFVALRDGLYHWPAMHLDGDSAALLDFLGRHRGECGDLFLLGTGARALLPPPVTLAAGLEALGLGLEAMDTAAAIRTYNILLNENRVFAAGFLIE